MTPSACGETMYVRDFGRSGIRDVIDGGRTNPPEHVVQHPVEVRLEPRVKRSCRDAQLT